MERINELEEKLESLRLEIEMIQNNQDALFERLSEIETGIQVSIYGQGDQLTKEVKKSQRQRGKLWMAICVLIGLVFYVEVSKNKVPDFVTGSVLMGLVGCALTIASGKSEMSIEEAIKIIQKKD